MKMSTSLKDLCRGCPNEFIEYFEYCKKLEFKEKPDYDYLKGIFQRIANDYSINLFDHVYDWSIRAVTIKHFADYFDFIEN